MEFKAFKENSFVQRQHFVKQIRQLHPNKIPVVIERFSGEKNLPQINNKTFLLSEHVTMGELVGIVRRRFKLQRTQSLFLLINQTTSAQVSSSLAQVYEAYKADDGFLYIVYASQEALGL